MGFRSNPELAVSHNGQLNLFIITDDGHLYYSYRDPESKRWSGWQNLGQPPQASPKRLVCRPACVAMPDGRLELFIVTEDDRQLWYLAQLTPGGPWHSWLLIHGPRLSTQFNRTLTLVRDVEGGLDLFIITREGKLCQRNHLPTGGNWATWISHSSPATGPLVQTPGATMREDGRLEVFAIGGDGNLYYKRQDGGLNSWLDWQPCGHPLGGSLHFNETGTMQPEILRSRDGHLEVFVADGDLHRLFQASDGSWSQWQSYGHPPGTTIQGNVQAVQRGSGDTTLFMAGLDGKLYEFRPTSTETWGEWVDHGRPPAVSLLGQPAVLEDAENGLEIFVLGENPYQGGTGVCYTTYDTTEGSRSGWAWRGMN